jgi:hypothetical protein
VLVIIVYPKMAALGSERRPTMKKSRVLNLMTRFGLFALILGFGTVAALAIDETEGVALANLSNTSLQVVATTAQDDVK